VGNLPMDIEEEPLREHFSQFGDVDYVRLIRDKISKKAKGVAYINFTDKYERCSVIDSLFVCLVFSFILSGFHFVFAVLSSVFQ
jgi:RNA recognition motif-containing protein